MCLVLKVKKFEFWRARLGEPSIGEPRTFVKFTLFLISTHSENFIHLVAAV